MVRRYEEPIEVRAGAGGADPASDTNRAGDISCPDPTPSAFLWRGRLYVVRDVIGHWRERRACGVRPSIPMRRSRRTGWTASNKRYGEWKRAPVDWPASVSYTHLTLPTNREV